jgi:hypothetical protein
LISLLAAVSLAVAQDRDQYGNAQQDENGARNEYGEVQQTVARLSYMDGSVSYARGDQPDDWQAADRNVPMTIGDRVYTGNRSRLELQVQGGDSIRLGAQTDLAALNLTDDTKQFSIKAGVGSFHVRNLDQNEVFEIDTPNAALTVEEPGDYRVDVDPNNGNSQIFIRHGRATVAAGGGQVPLQTGDEMSLQGIDNPTYDVVSIRRQDGWDQWVDEREGRVEHAHSLQYVSRNVEGVDDLDQYGQWQQVPNYGWAWAPASVAPGWVPYTVGHWIWQDPWGWTWVSAEPWGWAPYHYGRWVVASSRWYWVPVAPAVRVAVYSPALVAFVGGGPGWSATVAVGGGGFVGWFPLAPADPFVHWWGRPAAVNVNVTNVTYVNKTYVTVVNQNTFVSGGVVNTAVVRDTTVVRQVVAAPVVRGPLPVVPTVAALRVAARPGLPAPPRPPAAIVARPVVARVAPPPAPPTFQAKLAVIQQNRGAPVTTVEAAKISVQARGRAEAVTSVRPVTAEAGRVSLAPRTGAPGAQARKVEPVTAAPVRGRAVATASQPVASAPVTSNFRGATGAAGGKPQTIERGSLPRENAPSGNAGQSQTLERRVVTPVERGRQGGGPPPQPTARTLERKENAVQRSQPANTPSIQKYAREPQTGTREPIQRATPQPPPPRSNVSSEAISNEGGRGRERVVTPVPQGHTENESRGGSQVESESQGKPHNSGGNSGGQSGDQKKKEQKPKPEKTPPKS